MIWGWFSGIGRSHLVPVKGNGNETAQRHFRHLNVSKFVVTVRRKFLQSPDIKVEHLWEELEH